MCNTTIKRESRPIAPNGTKETLKQEKIDLNGSEISDVIFQRGNQFINATTGATGCSIEEVKRNRNYILKSLCLTKEDAVKGGIYVKKSETFDALIFVTCKFVMDSDTKGHYEEYVNDYGTESRMFVSKNFRIPCERIFDEPTTKATELFDICGQYMNGVSSYGGAYTRKLLMDYFGGFVFCNQYVKNILSHIANEHLFSNIGNTVRFANVLARDCTNYSYGNDITVYTGIMEYLDDDITEIKEVNPVAMERMERFVKKFMVEDSYMVKKYSFYNDERNYTMSCIERYGSKLVVRSFLPVLFIDYNGNTIIRITEFKRMVLNEKNYSNPANSRYGSICMYHDDLSGTVLEYTSEVLDCAIDALIAAFDDDSVKTYDDMEARYREMYGRYENYDSPYVADIRLKNAVHIATYLAMNSIVERVYKTLSSKGKGLLGSRISNDVMSEGNLLYGIAGIIDTKESELHKILQIPKGLLEYIKEKDYNILTIGCMKNIFFTDEQKTYLKSMNETDYKFLADKVDEKSLFQNPIATSIIYTLVSMQGANNWKGYIRHLENLIETGEDLRIYNSYLSMLTEINDALEGCDEGCLLSAEWKVTGEALCKAYHSACEAYGAIGTDTDIMYAEDYFNSMAKSWEELEYLDDDKYIITYPKKPLDVIYDGFYLNHCGKTFISPILDGISTILFMRKKEAPDKPFYTIEINEDWDVKQCHGKNNCIVADGGEDLKNFLNGYIAKKGLGIFHESYDSQYDADAAYDNEDYDDYGDEDWDEE